VRCGKCSVSRWTICTERIRAAIAAAPQWWTPDYYYVGDRFEKDRSRAGLASDISIHCLRHRFATRLLRGGTDILSIQDLLGHRDLATTAIYLHDDPRRFEKARFAIEGALYPQLSFSDDQLLHERRW
jgi:integrase